MGATLALPGSCKVSLTSVDRPDLLAWRSRRRDHFPRPADGPAARRRPELQGLPERDRDGDPALPVLGRAQGGGRAGRERPRRLALGALLLARSARVRRG